MAFESSDEGTRDASGQISGGARCCQSWPISLTVPTAYENGAADANVCDGGKIKSA